MPDGVPPIITDLIAEPDSNSVSFQVSVGSEAFEKPRESTTAVLNILSTPTPTPTPTPPKPRPIT